MFEQKKNDLLPIHFKLNANLTSVAKLLTQIEDGMCKVELFGVIRNFTAWDKKSFIAFDAVVWQSQCYLWTKLKHERIFLGRMQGDLKIESWYDSAKTLEISRHKVICTYIWLACDDAWDNNTSQEVFL